MNEPQYGLRFFHYFPSAPQKRNESAGQQLALYTCAERELASNLLLEQDFDQLRRTKTKKPASLRAFC